LVYQLYKNKLSRFNYVVLVVSAAAD